MKLRDGLRIEEIDGETVVFDSSSGASMHRLTGDAVDALSFVADGASEDVPNGLRAAVDELVDAGILEEPTELSRRRALIAGGVVWGAATVTTFALADPAAAQTPCTSPGPSAAQVKFETVGENQYVTGRGVTSIKVRTWGGGGGGGRYWLTYDGGGGGGGAYAENLSLTVSPCTVYKVTVGGGGHNGTSDGDNGGPGGASEFRTSAGSVLVKAAGGNGGGGAGAFTNPGPGGSGGSAASCTGAYSYSGGNGGGGGGGGGSAGGGSAAGAGSAGSVGTDPNGGAGGGTSPYKGGTGGDLAASGTSGNGKDGLAPGGGGGGGDYWYEFPLGHQTAGGVGARGAVWIGY